MRVGITGGTGFLGRALLPALAASGHAVTVFTRNPERARGSLPPAVEAAKWDLLREPLPPAVLDTLDAVIHLAGESVVGLWTDEKKQRIRASRATGTHHVAEGFRTSTIPPRILLSSSASGYYGDGGENTLDEDSPPGDGFLSEVCVAWEREAAAAAETGARVVYLRTSLPLHPQGGLLQTMLRPFRFGLGGKIGNGKQWMPWLHLEDWVALVLFALERDSVTGPLNCTGPHPVRNETFTATLARVLGRPAFFTVPGFVLKAVLREAAEELALAGQRVVPARALAHGFTFRHPDLEGALRHLLDG